MHAKPFTNSIAVGTEAVTHLWKSLESVSEAATLARLVVAGAIPQREAMLRSAVDGYTSATEMANRLVIEGGLSFRVAHRKVGNVIREAIERGTERLEDAAARWQSEEGEFFELVDLDPTSVARRATYGGGPGALSLYECLKALQEKWAVHKHRSCEQARAWRTADQALDAAARSLCAAQAEKALI
jgi:argininosuccinate lyase